MGRRTAPGERDGGRTAEAGRGRPGVGGPRRAALTLAAIALAVAGVLVPAAAPAARAATDGLGLTTAATYTVVPARHVVHVVVAVTAVNNKPNVASGGLVTKYFYDGARIGIQPEATAIRATAGGVRLATTTTPADGYHVLEIRFRSSLFYHQTARLTVAYDLPGGAPRSTSDIRVGPAFATFVAWAFGDRGSVRVVVPPGFDAVSTGSTATRSTSGGSTVFEATGIADVGAWYLVVNADRPTGLTSDRVDLAGGEHVVIRAWPEDATWKTRVGSLLARGLPRLVADIGLAWPVTGDLSIFEVHTPLLEGYAGRFIEGRNRIDISEDLDDLTIVHEASHAWFNSDLFEGRWIDEGLADAYAARTLDALGIAARPLRTARPSDRAAIALEDWTFPGRIADAGTAAREEYGYDASRTVVLALVTDVGPDAMRDVLAAAASHRIAYVGAGTPETVTGPNDWRRFLDLLDEVGRARTADDLFRQWVVGDADAAALADRDSARAAYADLAAAAGDWAPPFSVRSALSDWDFATASQRIADARAVVAQRDDIAARAATLGVTPPTDLRTAYESARTDVAGAAALATRELADVDALRVASEAVAAPRAPLVALGLLGTTPEAGLADARSAFAAGLADAAARAMAVTALIDGAADVGRGRLGIAIVGLAAVLVVLGVALALAIHRRRHRRPTVASGPGELAVAGAAGAAGAVPAGATDPAYVTLADQSDRPPDADPLPTGSAAPAGIDPGAEPARTDPPSPEPARSRPAATEPAATEPAETARPDPTDPTGPPPADRGDAS